MADELLVTTPLGFRAAGDARPDLTWTVSTISGWFERPGVRQDRQGRPWGHGNFLAPSYREAKLPAFEGLVLTDSGFSQARELERLEAVLGNGDLTRLTVQGPAGTTWADAQLDSEPSFEMGRFGTTLKYRVTMYVPSGFRYGERRSFSSGEAAYHRGTADALPSFVVTGSMPSGYRIESPGGTFTVTQPLASGQTHRIDFADGGLVYRNGALQAGVYAHPRQTWAIPRGARWTHTLVPVSGSGSLTVNVTDTF